MISPYSAGDAKALLKAEEGDVVEVRTPKGVERLEVEKIEY